MACSRSGAITLALLLALPAFTAVAAPEASSPREVVAEFYAWDIGRPALNDATLLGPVRHLLSKEMVALADATDAYQKACEPLALPDEKPWMLEIDPWHSEVEGALASGGISVIAATDTAARVAVELSYDELHWTDTVILVKQDGDWRIADIRLEHGGGMVENLGHFIRGSCGYDLTQ